jgi:hypothetical protein
MAHSPRQPLWRRVLLSVTAGALAVAGTGCASRHHPAMHLDPAATRSFDLLRGAELGLVDFAQQKIRNRCLADAGYPQNLTLMPDHPANPFAGAVPTARTFGPTSEDEARRLGFGADAPAQPARIVSFDPRYDRNLQRCATAAWDRLGTGAAQVYDNYFDLANSLTGPFSREVGRRIPADLPEKSFDCLAGKGFQPPDRQAFLAEPNPRKQFTIAFGGLDGGPDTWEPARTPGTVQVGPPVPAKRYVPTPAESALAVAWFQCGRETRRVELFLAAADQVQRELVDTHEAQLAELNPKVEALARRAARFIDT